MCPVRYELGFYIPEDDILHSHRRENLKSYIALTGWTLSWRRNVSPVTYELGLCDVCKGPLVSCVSYRTQRSKVQGPRECDLNANPRP
jgi:hypothetical protein